MLFGKLAYYTSELKSVPDAKTLLGVKIPSSMKKCNA